MSSIGSITFPPEGMACPEEACKTPVYRRYASLVQHWKATHKPTIDIFRCRMCSKSHTRRSDANRHVRNCHGAGVDVVQYPNRRYLKPSNTMPLRTSESIPPLHVCETMAAVPAPIPRPLQDQQQTEAREAARRERQRIREEAERGSLTAMVNRERDCTLPAERGLFDNFTLCSPGMVLDYDDQ